MIKLYSGTPGSGKSLHAIKDICFYLTHNRNVIANFPVNVDKIKRSKRCKMGKFIYMDNSDFTVNFLTKFALDNHVKGKEKQTVIVFDEAQAIFNPRDFRRSDRMDWNHFFTIHRHLGFNVLLITQNDRLLDRQIRCLIEYQVKHRKLNNFGTFGALLPISVFACIEYWYGVNEKLGSEFLVYKKYYSNLYDSYALFDRIQVE